MGDVIDAAQGMGDAVNHSHHGVRKGDAGQKTAHLHGTPRLQVVRLGTGLQDIARDEGYGVQRQGIGCR